MATRRQSKPVRRSMPKWQPAPAALVRQFETVMQAMPDVQVRKMFGYPAAFVRGQMFAGVFQDHMFVRLSENDRADFLKRPGARPFEPMPGRPMREYVVVPSSMLTAEKQLHAWLEKASACARSLPPKRPKTR